MKTRLRNTQNKRNLKKTRNKRNKRKLKRNTLNKKKLKKTQNKRNSRNKRNLLGGTIDYNLEINLKSLSVEALGTQKINEENRQKVQGFINNYETMTEEKKEENMKILIDIMDKTNNKENIITSNNDFQEWERKQSKVGEVQNIIEDIKVFYDKIKEVEGSVEDKGHTTDKFAYKLKKYKNNFFSYHQDLWEKFAGFIKYINYSKSIILTTLLLTMLVYLKDEYIFDKINELNHTDIQIIETGNDRIDWKGFKFDNKKCIISKLNVGDHNKYYITFKGTDSIVDLLNDVNNTSVMVDDFITYHEGFLESYNMLNIYGALIINKTPSEQETCCECLQYKKKKITYILENLNITENDEIIFTGHSLGGAMATIATIKYLKTFFEKKASGFTIRKGVTIPTVRLITYAAPPVVDANSANILNDLIQGLKEKTQYLFFEGANDPIPRAKIGNFCHIYEVGNSQVEYRGIRRTSENSCAVSKAGKNKKQTFKNYRQKCVFRGGGEVQHLANDANITAGLIDIKEPSKKMQPAENIIYDDQCRFLVYGTGKPEEKGMMDDLKIITVREIFRFGTNIKNHSMDNYALHIFLSYFEGIFTNNGLQIEEANLRRIQAETQKEKEEAQKKKKAADEMLYDQLQIQEQLGNYE
jgi:hypothetical protein